MISSKRIGRIVDKLYPRCDNVWLRDRSYYALTIDELIKFIEDNTPIAGDGDCDDRADILHGLSRSEGLKEYAGTWAFGTALLDELLGQKVYHAMNIAITSNEKLWLVEPKNGAYWVADPKEDNIYFIYM